MIIPPPWPCLPVQLLCDCCLSVLVSVQLTSFLRKCDHIYALCVLCTAHSNKLSAVSPDLLSDLWAGGVACAIAATASYTRAALLRVEQIFSFGGCTHALLAATLACTSFWSHLGVFAVGSRCVTPFVCPVARDKCGDRNQAHLSGDYCPHACVHALRETNYLLTNSHPLLAVNF